MNTNIPKNPMVTDAAVLHARCSDNRYISISIHVIRQYVTTTGVIMAVDNATSTAINAAGPLSSSRRRVASNNDDDDDGSFIAAAAMSYRRRGGSTRSRQSCHLVRAQRTDVFVVLFTKGCRYL